MTKSKAMWTRAAGWCLGAMAVALLALPMGAAAETSTWQIDASHSSVQFSIKHLMVSNVRGVFSKFDGKVTVDGEDPASAKVEATIDVASIDTRDAKRDEHLRAPDFFDVAKFPTMTFKSKQISSAGAGKLKLVGDLTMHGVTKEVSLDVEGPTAPVKSPFDGGQRVGVTASGKINRKDFGLTWNKALDSGGMVIGEEVGIVIELELARK